MCYFCAVSVTGLFFAHTGWNLGSKHGPLCSGIYFLLEFFGALSKNF